MFLEDPYVGILIGFTAGWCSGLVFMCALVYVLTRVPKDTGSDESRG